MDADGLGGVLVIHRDREARCERGAQSIAVRVVEAMWRSVAKL